MAIKGKNWTVDSYTANTWTDIVDVPSRLEALIVANTTAGALNAQIRIVTAAGVQRSVVLPLTSIAGYTSNALDVAGLRTGHGDKIQVKGSAAGLSFTASGEPEEG